MSELREKVKEVMKQYGLAEIDWTYSTAPVHYSFSKAIVDLITAEKRELGGEDGE